MSRKKGHAQENPQKKSPRRARGEGSVTLRKDGRYMARIPIGHGEYKTEYYESKGDAERARRRMLNERDTNTLVTERDQTFEEYLKYWLDAHRMSVRETTYMTHRGYLYTRVIPALGHVRLRKLTVAMFQKLYQSWEKEEHPLSPNTIRGIHSIVRQALEDAVRWKKLTYNPVQYVKLPKAREADIPMLTKEEIERLLQCAQQMRLYALIRMALLLGMRVGELLGLKWADIDFEAATLKIERTVTYMKDPDTEKYHFLVGEPKTEASKRTIPLPQDIVEVLRTHREQQREIQANASHWEELDLVFCTNNGNYLAPHYIRHIFGELLRKAGLRHMKFHALRHNANAILRQMNVSAVVRKTILGHKKITMTDGVYGRATQEELQEAMQRIDSEFLQKLEEND